MDFTQAALRAGLRGRRALSVLLLPLFFRLFLAGEAPWAWVSFWTNGALALWWGAALGLLPPTRPLWRSRRPGFMRHAAPVLSALAAGQTACRAALGVLYMTAPWDGAWSLLFSALAAWGALLLGQAITLITLTRIHPHKLATAIALLYIPLTMATELTICLSH